MPSRRSHTNSHHGCLQCKARRVKVCILSMFRASYLVLTNPQCDQGQPVCARCTKKGQDCTYRHLMSSYDPFQRHAAPTQPTRTRIHHRSSPGAASASPVPSGSSSQGDDIPLHQNSMQLSTPLLLRPLSVPGLDPLTHQILHHYTASSSAFLTEPFQSNDVFSTIHAAIDRHLFAYPYVHQAVLTYSALHLASVLPSSLLFPASRYLPSEAPPASPHLVAAFSHKASALAHFRPVLESISSVNCEPALTASGLLVSCAFAMPIVSRQHAIGDEQDPIDLLAQIIALFNGTVVIFRMGWGGGIDPPLDEKSSMSIRRDVIRQAGKEAPWPEAEESLRAVISAISRLDDSPPQSHPDGKEPSGGDRQALNPGPEQQLPTLSRKEILVDIALKLRNAMRRVAAARGVYRVAIGWLSTVAPAFVERLQARDPLALVLLGHWILCLREMPHVWWTRGWAEWTVETICEEIGQGEYGPLMQWPRAEVGLSGENTHRAVSVG